LRQAYDYWQNQPGNYPEPAPKRWTPPGKGAALSVTIQVSARRSMRPPQELSPSRTGEQPATDSIAPTEFPRAPATAKTFGLMCRQIAPLERPERRRRAVSHTLLQAGTDRCFPQNL